MDLLDRYLSAVRSNLPAAKAEDITNELREDLLDRIEARERESGAPLREAEISSILKAYGPPLEVSGRFRQHPYLIGPKSFAYYLYTLRVVLVVVLGIIIFSGLVPVVLERADFVDAMLQSAGNMWLALFANFTIVTVMFAVFDRTGVIAKHIADWKPEQLPKVDERKKGKWESPVEVGLGLIFFLWWAGLIPVDLAYTGNGLHIEPAAIWSAYYWPILILLGARLILNLIEWLRPTWMITRTAIDLATMLGSIWVAGQLLAKDPLFSVTATDGNGDRAMDIARSISTSVHIALWVIIVTSTVALVMAVYRAAMSRLRGAR